MMAEQSMIKQMEFVKKFKSSELKSIEDIAKPYRDEILGLKEKVQMLNQLCEFNEEGQLRLLEQLAECKKEVDYKQSVIDNLMLEYCPNEMTEKQLSTWGENQRAYQDDASITKSAASARKD